METLLFFFSFEKRKCVSTLHEEQPAVSFVFPFGVHIAHGLFLFFGFSFRRHRRAVNKIKK